MQKNKKNEFNFKNAIIRYKPDNVLYVFYLTDDNVTNKEIDSIIKDMGYTRSRLHKSHPLIEVREGFDYKWKGIYISNDHLSDIEAEHNRWENIRKAPILHGNI